MSKCVTHTTTCTHDYGKLDNQVLKHRNIYIGANQGENEAQVQVIGNL